MGNSTRNKTSERQSGRDPRTGSQSPARGPHNDRNRQSAGQRKTDGTQPAKQLPGGSSPGGDVPEPDFDGWDN